MLIARRPSLFLFSLFCLGCSPTRGYSGPERAPTDLSTVYFYSDRIELSDLEVDGVYQGLGMGLTVLPGPHSASTEYKVKGTQCGFLDCLPAEYHGVCTTNFSTAPGKTYRVDVSGNSDSALISVAESETKNPVGSGTCNTRGWEYIREDEKKGR